ncbi:P-loop containing nucleoside triphosphate hydrolase protein [Phlebopus sp. FC_14]|nr:P-loop containing nucleoside triphosphate hydrolase protein [Phlebopus sp. FC_14]
MAAPSSKRVNIVVFGEIGSGKSSLVNLIVGSNVAETSSDAGSCTLDARYYDAIVQNRSFRIYDTVGLNEPEFLAHPDSLVSAINKGYRLVKSLADEGGISLLLFCVRRGRITTNMQNNYKIFQDFFCQKKVPVALVVTHCDGDGADEWWEMNHEDFAYFGIHAVAHACITANPKFASLYPISRQKVCDLLLRHSSGEGFTMEKATWIAELIRNILVMVGIKPRIDSLKARSQKLRECGLADSEIEMVLKRISSLDRDLDTLRRFRRSRPALFAILNLAH